jgi:membrane associated rhomboid family serine protease
MNLLGFEGPVITIALACLLLSLVTYGLGALKRRQASLLVEVGPTRLSAPRRRGARYRVEIPLEEVREALLVGRVWSRVLVIPERGARLALPTRAFVDPDAPERLVRELQRRIAELPDGNARLQRSGPGAVATGAAGGRLPWVTLCLGLACLLGFTLELLVGAPGHAERMLALGANHPVLVWQGELHRLVTANLLHGNVPHLVVNLIVIALVGPILERMLGWRRTTIVVGVSAIGGSFVTALRVGDVYTIGVSTVCMGLIGCWSVLNMRYREQTPGMLRVSRPIAIVAVLQFVLYELVAARSSFSGHMGGYLFGSAATFLVTREPELHRLRTRTPPWLLWALAAVVGAVLLGLARGVQRAVVDLPGL